MNRFKGFSESVKLKFVLFAFAASVVILLPVRVYQLIAIVEPKTGFFSGSDITVGLIYALAIIFPLAFLVFSYVSKEVPSPKLPVGKNALLSVSSVLMAVGFATDIIKTEKSFIPSFSSSAEQFAALLKINLTKRGSFFTGLEFIFAIFAFIYFVIFATSHLGGKASYKEYKFLALTPLLWGMSRLITKLIQAISFVRVSELLFEIFMLVFLMLFFMTFARISTGIFTEDGMWGIYGYGLCAALFAALITVPRLVMLVIGKEPVSGNEFNFCDLSCLIFVLTYIFASFGVGFKGGIKERKNVSEVELPDETEVVEKEEYDNDIVYDYSEEVKKEPVKNDDYGDVLAAIDSASRKPDGDGEDGDDGEITVVSLADRKNGK